ncbi:Uncharacterized protein SCF082_LOCUS17377 [Durusdinium trenchii]|uniref:ABM domain-containing protein n=1 Tax=Durusdinium trenchii TaxID=1381693 RepID=A0ABP0KI27_9DINO
MKRELIYFCMGSAAASLLLSFGFGVSQRPSKTKGFPSAWSLTIQLRFKDVATRDEFLRFWAPLARYVRDAEPFALLFEAVQSDKDPLLVIVDERYSNKEVYMELHRSSAAFHQFRPQMKKLQDEGRLEVSGESGFGIGLDTI